MFRVAGLTRYAGAGWFLTGARQSGQVLFDRPPENHDDRHCTLLDSAHRVELVDTSDLPYSRRYVRKQECKARIEAGYRYRTVLDFEYRPHDLGVC